ncbi:MAG TPA: Ig-like domain-containing protein, partial [Thermoanaerobaculia bacterium]
TAAVAGATGELNEVSVAVTADFTPPALLVTANGLALAEGARFAVGPRIALEATDNVPAGLVTRLTVDGAAVTGELPLLGEGGHALTAIARDAAGNETRVDRTFFVGTAASGGGCALTNFDPVDGAAVFTSSVRIAGRSGGAAAVLIDGKSAQVADGSFCGEATLVPGRNEVTIRCADASGNPTADAPVTLVLWRDIEPTVTITSPVASSDVTTDSITVSGTVSEGVVSGEVNGLPMTISGNTFSVAQVVLTSGLNVVTARVKSGSGRVAVATTRVISRTASPQLAITSPLAGAETGASSLDVSGTYVNVDPSTIRVGGTSAATNQLTDTSGTFTATVSLAPGARTTIAATARNHAGTQASDSAEVQNVVGNPAIAITAPADNAYVTASPLRVSGTIAADAGSLVQVNGVPATVTGNTFVADVEINSGSTPVVARVTTPGGAAAADNIRVVRPAAALAVRDTFPAADATNVDRGAALILLFNNVLDATTAANAVRLTDSANAVVAGEVFVDRDALTFAPAAALKAGEAYTLATATSLRDASGVALAAAHTLRFTTAETAPAAAPVVDELVTAGCLSSVVLTGRAAPAARVRFEADGITLNTTAADSGAFKFTFSFSGQAGFHLARVRQVGTDGSLSADRAICFRIDCELPRVIGAALDRSARKLTVDFSRPMNPSTLVAAPGGTILVVPQGGVALNAAVSVTGETATLTFAEELPAVTVNLTVTKAVEDAAGASPAADYTQRFMLDDSQVELGKGYVTGAVYDATTGRPLANAAVTIEGVTLATNDRGRYSRPLGEGAYTIEARADGYTAAWRQVVVPAGAGVVPIDIRLARRGPAQTTNGSSLTFTHGGDTAVTRVVELTLAAASLPPSH